MVTTILPIAPDQVGRIFQQIPQAVCAAWEAHRLWASIGRKLTLDEAEQYITTLLTLQRAVKRHGRRPGYFPLDDKDTYKFAEYNCTLVRDHMCAMCTPTFLVGYGGPAFDPKWGIYPDTSPITGGVR